MYVDINISISIYLSIPIIYPRQTSKWINQNLTKGSIHNTIKSGRFCIKHRRLIFSVPPVPLFDWFISMWYDRGWDFPFLHSSMWYLCIDILGLWVLISFWQTQWEHSNPHSGFHTTCERCPQTMLCNPAHTITVYPFCWITCFIWWCHMITHIYFIVLCPCCNETSKREGILASWFIFFFPPSYLGEIYV